MSLNTLNKVPRNSTILNADKKSKFSDFVKTEDAQII